MDHLKSENTEFIEWGDDDEQIATEMKNSSDNSGKKHGIINHTLPHSTHKSDNNYVLTQTKCNGYL